MWNERAYRRVAKIRTKLKSYQTYYTDKKMIGDYAATFGVEIAMG
jgi:hypothetical protein